jgi:hypothetical protein
MDLGVPATSVCEFLSTLLLILSLTSLISVFAGFFFWNNVDVKFIECIAPNGAPGTPHLCESGLTQLNISKNALKIRRWLMAKQLPSYITSRGLPYFIIQVNLQVK